tara:strand:+ start:83 stop:475 length:393 start_codon:yes stop_codon:yes gene_type:complete
MISLNYLINLLNLSLIFIYFIFINIELVNKEFEYLLISLIVINLSIKLYSWNITSKKNLHITFKNNFFNVRLTRLSIFIFSIVTPIYMIVQKDSLAIDLFIEKLSFLLVFIFSFVGFYLEFFILERKSNK